MKTDRSIKEFLAEAEDILETAGSLLLVLESGLETGTKDPDKLNALFRAVHTFKGLAALFGLSASSEVAHKLESLLDGLRLGKVILNPDILDLLTETVTLLGRQVRQAATQQPFDQGLSIRERIDRILLPQSSPAYHHSLKEHIAVDPGILQVLTEYEEHRLQECIGERKNLFLVKTEFSLAEFETAIKDLNAILKKHGEIICTLPMSGARTAGIGFSILVATADNQEQFSAAISLRSGAVEHIPYRDTVSAEEQKQENAELKSVSNTVRVDIYKLDQLMNIVGEMHLVKNIIGRIGKELRVQQGFVGISMDLFRAQRSLERKLNSLQEGIVEVRMVPIGQIFTRLSHMVKKYAREAGKDIDLQLFGEETRLDKLMIEDLADPLMHLIRNAIDHGIEPSAVRQALGKPEQGVVRLRAFPLGNHVVITIEDDGAGMDPKRILAAAVERGIVKPNHQLDPERDSKEILDLIYVPGFTTRGMVTELSGRGVGMDVVKQNVSKLAGMVDIQSMLGTGTLFTLTLPITLAIIKALIIESGGQIFSIPLSSVLEIHQATNEDIETIEGQEVLSIRNDTLPLLRLANVFHLPQDDARIKFYVIVVGLAERRLGLIVDDLRDQQEIVIKSLGKRLSDIPGVAGATELGDKRGVSLVLDVESLIENSLTRLVTVPKNGDIQSGSPGTPEQ
ncbi:MAG: chemotaxis protein CheA [Nitrospirota bacterium]